MRLISGQYTVECHASHAPPKALFCCIYLTSLFRRPEASKELRREGTLRFHLQPQVFDLLEYLIRHRARVVTKDDLISAIWGGRII